MSVRFAFYVIPGRREAANPESSMVRGYGFRVRAFGASRNDGGRDAAR